MKNVNKPCLLPNFLFSAFRSIAKTSGIMSPNYLWQEPEIPKCMLDKEKEKANK
jgi:hypothetical protein